MDWSDLTTYVGQVWESRDEGVFIVLWEEVFNDLNILVMLRVERGTLAYLPKYIIYANDLCQDDDPAWKRVS